MGSKSPTRQSNMPKYWDDRKVALTFERDSEKKRFRRPPTMGPIRQSRCDGTQHDIPPDSKMFSN